MKTVVTGATGNVGARVVQIPAKPLRALADLSWRARLQPTPAGWLDMGLAVPVMDTSRAREPAALDTPPLHPRAGSPLRTREFLSGLGQRCG